MHGIIVICDCNRLFSVLVIYELFSKVIVIDPKVIDNSLRSGLFACYSNC